MQMGGEKEVISILIKFADDPKTIKVPNITNRQLTNIFFDKPQSPKFFIGASAFCLKKANSLVPGSKKLLWKSLAKLSDVFKVHAELNCPGSLSYLPIPMNYMLKEVCILDFDTLKVPKESKYVDFFRALREYYIASMEFKNEPSTSFIYEDGNEICEDGKEAFEENFIKIRDMIIEYFTSENEKLYPQFAAKYNEYMKNLLNELGITEAMV